MNKARRASLTTLQSRLIAVLEELEFLKDEEQDGFDNLPEALQQGERGSKMEQAVSTMETAIDSLNEAISSIEEAQA